MHIFAAAAALALFSAQAGANVIYHYTGNPFDTLEDDAFVPGSYDTSMRITAHFEFADPLGPDLNLVSVTDLVLRAAVFDGRYLIEPDYAAGDLGGFSRVSTDAFGNITTWNFAAGQFPDFPRHNPAQDISSINVPGSFVGDRAVSRDTQDNLLRIDSGGNRGAAGSWRMETVSAVPEPGSVPLVALALGVVSCTLRRRGVHDGLD